MTRSEFTALLAKKYPALQHDDVEIGIKTILRAMSQCLGNGQRIEIRGFGAFETNARPARTGRNPKTGEAVAIPEKRVVRFRAGKDLRERVDS